MMLEARQLLLSGHRSFFLQLYDLLGVEVELVLMIFFVVFVNSSFHVIHTAVAYFDAVFIEDSGTIDSV